VLKLDEANRAVVWDGRVAVVPELTFRFLRSLLERSPAITPFASIESEVWGAMVSRETLKQRAKLLRDALNELGADCLVEAVRNEGYRLRLRSKGNATSHTGPRYAAPLVNALLALVAIVALPSLSQFAGPPARLSLSIESNDSPLRNDLLRDLSRFDAINVIDGSGAQSDLVVRIATGGASTLLTLQDARSGAILFAETYATDRGGSERVAAHFSSFVHERVQALRPYPALPSRLRIAYGEALELIRGGDEAALLLARARLRQVTNARPHFLLAAALLARVEADLVLRFDYPSANAESARSWAAALVSRHPEIPELRYALARTELACGNDEVALEQLRYAARDLPFLQRDIKALERRLEGLTT
jgi:DNA-binding winged helix-turn-helix (wHTH) protein